jgi:hypothetical protein
MPTHLPDPSPRRCVSAAAARLGVLLAALPPGARRCARAELVRAVARSRAPAPRASSSPLAGPAVRREIRTIAALVADVLRKSPPRQHTRVWRQFAVGVGRCLARIEKSARRAIRALASPRPPAWSPRGQAGCRGCSSRNAAALPGPSDGWAGRFHALGKRLAAYRGEFQALVALLGTDVPGALNKMRYVSEKALHELCTARGVSWGQSEPTLERMIGPLLAGGCIPKAVALHLRTVQGIVSPGSHYQDPPLSPAHAFIAAAALLEFLGWFAGAGPEARRRLRLSARPDFSDTVEDKGVSRRGG